MIQPDVLFKIHFLLFKFRIRQKLKFDIEKIDKECKINDHNLTSEHCDFLEYKKYLIRNWNQLGDDSKGYEQIQSGDFVMLKIWPKITKILRDLHDDRVNLILDEAENQIDKIKIILYMVEQGEIYKNKLPVILETIHNEYWNYVKNLQVFHVEIDPDKLNVTNSNGIVNVSGTISEPYLKTTGKILFRISLLDFKEEEEIDGNVTFAKGSISGAISFPHGYQKGEHVLYGYFQLKGERPPNRYDAYAKTEKIPIKIISA